MGTATDKWLLPDTRSNVSGSMYRGLTTSPIADLRYGAQNGFIDNPAEFAASASYIQGNLICLLVEAPSGFDKLNHADRRRATLKSLVEEQARTITGLNSTLTVSVNETPIGGAGEIFQDLNNVTQARSTPTFTWDERIGRAIGLYMEDWIKVFGMDPTTKVPQIVNYNNDVSPKDFLSPFKTMTCLFFEPDPTFKTVTAAWLCSNMFPMSAGDNTGTRDLTTAGANREISIEFTSITQVGIAVTEFAQKKLDDMNLMNVNPYHHPALASEISKEVEAAESGFIKGMDVVDR